MRMVPAVTFSEMVGMELSPSGWFHVDQKGVDLFAEATLDRQPIHVDPEAARAGPFGVTIAHGFYLLSLTSHWLFEQLVCPEGAEIFINYGLDRVRFICPVKVGADVRLRTVIEEIRDTGEGKFMVRVGMTLEIKGEQRPAFAAEMLLLMMPKKDSLEN